MKTGQFIKVVANAFGVAEPTVKQFVRAMKDTEPALFSVGLRGRYSPDVTALDAAHTVIALLGTDRPSSAPETVRMFRDFALVAYPGDRELPPKLAEMEPRPTLSEFLEGLFAWKIGRLLLYKVEFRPAEYRVKLNHWPEAEWGAELHEFFFSQEYETEEEVLAAAEVEYTQRIIQTSRAVRGDQLTEIAVALKQD